MNVAKSSQRRLPGFSALWLLLGLMARGWLRNPGRWLLLIVSAGVGALTVGATLLLRLLYGRADRIPATDAESVGAVVAFLAWVCVTSAIHPGAFTVSRSAAVIALSAPVSRRAFLASEVAQVAIWSLLFGLLGAVCTSIPGLPFAWAALVLFACSWLFLGAVLWLDVILFKLGGRARAAAALLLVAAALSLGFAAARAGSGLAGEARVDAILGVLAKPLAIGHALPRLLLTEDIGASLPTLAGLLTAAGLVAWATIRTPLDLRDALERRTAARGAWMPLGSAAPLRRPERRRDRSWPRIPWWGGIGPHLARQISGGRPLVILIAILVFGAAFAAVDGANDVEERVRGTLARAIVALTFFPGLLQATSRQATATLPWLKSLPQRPRTLLLGQLLGPCLFAAGLQALASLAGLVLSSPARRPVWILALIVAPAATFVAAAVGRALFLRGVSSSGVAPFAGLFALLAWAAIGVLGVLLFAAALRTTGSVGLSVAAISAFAWALVPVALKLAERAFVRATP